MVAVDDLDLQAGVVLGEIVGSELGGDDGALAGLVGERAGLVVQHTDLERMVRDLGLRGGRRERGSNDRRKKNDAFHDVKLP